MIVLGVLLKVLRQLVDAIREDSHLDLVGSRVFGVAAMGTDDLFLSISSHRVFQSLARTEKRVKG